jgi:hypothetical protein
MKHIFRCKEPIKLITLSLLLVSITSCSSYSERREKNNRNKIQNVQNISLKAVDKVAEINRTLYPNLSDEALITEMKEIVKLNLIDPDSAKFYNMKVVNYGNGRIVCGIINSKNRMGGYTGQKRLLGAMILDINSIKDFYTLKSGPYKDKLTAAYYAGYTLACT